jgi:hypothetical protein
VIGLHMLDPPARAAIINLTTLGKTVLYSFIAGVGIAAVFGGGVTSAAGLVEAVRTGRTAAIVGWGALAVLCAGVTLAAIAAGIYEMTAG